MRNKQHPPDDDPDYGVVIRTRPTVCECNSIPVGEGDERTIPNPLCPRCDYDPRFLAEEWDAIDQEYGLRRTDDGEWIPAAEWDEETAMRKEVA